MYGTGGHDAQQDAELRGCVGCHAWVGRERVHALHGAGACGGGSRLCPSPSWTNKGWEWGEGASLRCARVLAVTV
eukprot:scaffold12891_cov118-Isochrysis_galbana.AAC.2